MLEKAKKREAAMANDKILTTVSPDSFMVEEIMREVELIYNHFDADYYLQHNSDVANLGIDPALHYCLFGWREMRDPSPIFSTRYYLNANPEVRKKDINPFWHYIVTGRHEGREGKLYHDSRKIEEDYERLLIEEKISVQRAFDADYYLSEYPDVAEDGQDPLDHFMRLGWKEGRNPNAKFSTQFYLEEYQDIKASNVNPFWHYVVAGEKEGRAATVEDLKKLEAESQKFEEINLIEGVGPSAVNFREISSEMLEILKPHFDSAYYVQNFPKAEILEIEPLVHFCIVGWKLGLDPSVDFSVLGYLELYPDVAESGVNPLWHYISLGRKEGREFLRPAEYAVRKQDSTWSDINAIKAEFDHVFYNSEYPDVRVAGIDPVKHYWSIGWREGRDPVHWFSSAYYLEANPDVRDLDLNPFWHYVVAGRAEGRLARHPGGYQAEKLAHTQPLEDTVLVWRRANTPPEKILQIRELCALLRKSLGGKSGGLMISIGHDNYRETPGGVQFCIQREEEAASSRKMSYLNLYPHQPLPRLSHKEEEPNMLVGLLLGGKFLGATTIEIVIKALKRLPLKLRQTEVVVHHLMGHQPEMVAELVLSLGKADCWMWLHDFFTLCPSYALQRNNVSFCGAPKIGSNACSLCLYGHERISHRKRIARFFETLNVHCIAPSRFAADYWKKRSDISPINLSVCEHMQIEWSGSRCTGTVKNQRPITVAFIGYPAFHKGWPVFERLAREYSGKLSELRFVYFGTSEIACDNIERIWVNVTSEDPDAMISALSEQNVDFVLHWATCAETFSFSTHEALAAGAYVITNPISGNVAATVRHSGLGLILADEADLVSFFCDGRVSTFALEVRSRRNRSAALVTRSDMTFAVLSKEAQQ